MGKYEGDMICDFVETYHIMDVYEYHPFFIYTLLKGLKETSRLKTKLNGNEYSIDMLFQAMIIDRLSLLVYTNTKDGQRGINKPSMLLDKMMHFESNNDNYMSFNSFEDFENYRKKLLKGGHKDE